MVQQLLGLRGWSACLLPCGRPSLEAHVSSHGRCAFRAGAWLRLAGEAEGAFPPPGLTPEEGWMGGRARTGGGGLWGACIVG